MTNETERLIVGIDGSDGSRAALAWAVEEAALRGLRVDALMAWHEPYATSAWIPPLPLTDEPIEAWHREQLADVIAGVDASGLVAPIEPILVRSGARHALLEASDAAALVVVGHTGTSELRDVLLGSVARYVLARASCPVAVVRGRRHDGTRRPVVVGFDGSDRSEAAVEWAVDEARRREVPLRVVHTWQVPYATMDIPLPPTYRDEVEAATEKRLDDELASLPDDVEAVGRVAEGPPAEAILAEADDADLVVVGSRGHGGLTGLLLGSVSQHLVSRSPCPVVVVHGEDDHDRP